MEPLESVAITVAAGIQGDFRGAVRPGKIPRRQVALIEVESWQSAMDELSLFEGTALPWYARRANLCVEGLRLPRAAGCVIAIGESCRIETTMECDPCSRMDELTPGLMAALTPDWRGGVLGRVLCDGPVSVGDQVRIL
ncbi:MOSC domain-containing protein [Novosphingobium profundi]|uniref:MOSC domain-containing protein n=1 Tax=Novosphingobium profundi TaxID=1774954 RepID=UPI001BD9A9A8|nr:MOSC domain-containing protein [Novosphingobium profundi]MBT0669584.1 MOSC domain-containing protein [Novosphingobium profundi]